MPIILSFDFNFKNLERLISRARKRRNLTGHFHQNARALAPIRLVIDNDGGA